jgi:hypothetical protein
MVEQRMSTHMQQGRDGRTTLTKAITAARRARGEFEPFWKRYKSELNGRQRRKGKGNKRLMNYPYVFEATFLPELAAQEPEVQVRTSQQFSHGAMAEAHQLAINAVLRRQKFIEELRLMVKDSMYSFMYAKTGMYPASAGDEGGGMDTGSFYGTSDHFSPTMPFIERISPFSAIWDDSAGSFDRCVYVGHEFTRDIDSVREDDRYEVAARLQSESRKGEDAERERFQSFNDDEIPDFCRLIELFVRPTRMLYTLLERAPDDYVVLRKVPFFGPAYGPYHMGGFMPVADEVLPLAPAAAWWDAYVEREINEQKANDQAQAEKRVAVADSDHVDGAKLFKNAKPDDLVVGPVNVREVHTGGVTRERLVWLESRSNALELLSGVTAQRVGIAKSGTTATGDMIADQNSNKRTMDMRRSIINFACECVSDVGWYIHNSPSFSIRATATSPDGLPADVEITGGPEVDPFTGEAMPGQPEWSEFSVHIDAKTLYIDNAEARRGKALQEADFIITKLNPYLMQHGVMVNPMAFSRRFAHQADMPGLVDMLIPATPEAMAMAQASQQKDGQQQFAVEDSTQTRDPVQSNIMRSPATNMAISEGAQEASFMREMATPFGANNEETSYF